MSEKKKRIIIGGISGGVTGLMLEFLRGSSYMGGVSVIAKAVLTGTLACLIYMLIIRIINKVKPAGDRKA